MMCKQLRTKYDCEQVAAENGMNTLKNEVRSLKQEMAMKDRVYGKLESDYKDKSRFFDPRF